MSSTNLSRRATLAGAASVPALALPVSVALAAPETAPAAIEPDPIFAAIEAHRDAFVCDMRAARIFSRLESGTPEYTPEYKAADSHAKDAYGLLSDAEDGLANTEPTTMAGVLALLAYVEDFHCQAVVHPDDPKNWHSEGVDLGKLIDEDVIDKFSGEPIELPFTFWVMRNVREALQGMAVQS
jgi:hypothetical protein